MPLPSLCWYYIFQALALLVAANGAPVITGKALGKRFARPIDNGHKLADGYRLFGNSKTWRGFFSAVLFSTVVAILFGIQPITGVLFGALTIAGDLLASFIKRRRGKVESSRARGLDILPESLVPLYFLRDSLELNLIEITIIVGFFFLIEEFVSPVLFRLHIRDQPY